MENEKPDPETVRIVCQSVLEEEEQGFIRHLIYNLMFRHGPFSRKWNLKHCRAAITMLRLKRQLSSYSDEKLISMGLDPSKKNINIGWTTTGIERSLELFKELKNGK